MHAWQQNIKLTKVPLWHANIPKETGEVLTGHEMRNVQMTLTCNFESQSTKEFICAYPPLIKHMHRPVTTLHVKMHSQRLSFLAPLLLWSKGFDAWLLALHSQHMNNHRALRKCACVHQNDLHWPTRTADFRMSDTQLNWGTQELQVLEVQVGCYVDKYWYW